jgi:hypothetical protein
MVVRPLAQLTYNILYLTVLIASSMSSSVICPTRVRLPFGLSGLVSRSLDTLMASTRTRS